MTKHYLYSVELFKFMLKIKEERMFFKTWLMILLTSKRLFITKKYMTMPRKLYLRIIYKKWFVMALYIHSDIIFNIWINLSIKIIFIFINAIDVVYASVSWKIIKLLIMITNCELKNKNPLFDIIQSYHYFQALKSR